MTNWSLINLKSGCRIGIYLHPHYIILPLKYLSGLVFGLIQGTSVSVLQQKTSFKTDLGEW